MPKNAARAGVGSAPELVTTSPVRAFLATMYGTDVAPKLLNSSVLDLIAASDSGVMLLGADMPLPPASSEVSCVVMACTGLAAVSKAAPCGVLLAFISDTGTQTNFIFDWSGSDAFQSVPQCGHCGSNST